jgi:hypothetical protein
MHGLFVALLAGAMSIAEGRALGTADVERVQPWSLWKQSLARIATAGVIALLLGLAVPVGLEAMLPLIESTRRVGPDPGPVRFLLPNPLNGAAATVLLTTLFSGYVSSLCVGGLRALLTALPLAVTLVSLSTYTFSAVAAVDPTLTREGFVRHYGATATMADYRTAFLYARSAAAVAFVGFAALLPILMLRNARSGEAGMTLAKRQLPWLAVYAVLAAVMVRGGEALLRWWLFTH